MIVEFYVENHLLSERKMCPPYSSSMTHTKFIAVLSKVIGFFSLEACECFILF